MGTVAVIIFEISVLGNGVPAAGDVCLQVGVVVIDARVDDSDLDALPTCYAPSGRGVDALDAPRDFLGLGRLGSLDARALELWRDCPDVRQWGIDERCRAEQPVDLWVRVDTQNCSVFPQPGLGGMHRCWRTFHDDSVDHFKRSHDAAARVLRQANALRGWDVRVEDDILRMRRFPPQWQRAQRLAKWEL